MRLKILAMIVGGLVLSWAAQDAHAGAIRYTGKQIGKGTVAVAQTTPMPRKPPVAALPRPEKPPAEWSRPARLASARAPRPLPALRYAVRRQLPKASPRPFGKKTGAGRAVTHPQSTPILV